MFKQFNRVILFSLSFCNLMYGGKSTVRYSDAFYAAQKYFYQEAKLKYPKIKNERAFPEIPIKGNIQEEELSKIEPLQDYFEARRLFIEEVSKYPEQIYPEVFNFLYNHPALKVAASNQIKQTAMEIYFSPFFALFSSDTHYAFHSEVKQNPCPIVFHLVDLKKNTVSFKLNNTSKTSYDLMVNEFPKQAYLNVVGKKPIRLKGGSSTTIKCEIDLLKLKSDSSFKSMNLVFNDPTQPRVKIIVPIILLPGKEFLSPSTQLYDLNFTYSTFFKHISLQKEKSSWPEPCPNSNCSEKKNYSLRSSNRNYVGYDFNDLCDIQYNISTQSSAPYNLKSNTYNLYYHELGNLAGEGRNCVDAKTGLEVHCATDAPYNGKELYGTRKLEWKLFVANGNKTDLFVNINYSDLSNQPELNSELSWLQEKVLVLVINDAAGKQVYKQFINRAQSTHPIKDLDTGEYSIELFPVTEDGKLKPSFNIQHLNHGGKSRFDFKLQVKIQVINHALNPTKKSK